jgi:hypothetical protein
MRRAASGAESVSDRFSSAGSAATLRGGIDVSAHSSDKSKPDGFDRAPRGHIVFVHDADRVRRIRGFIASEQPS